MICGRIGLKAVIKDYLNWKKSRSIGSKNSINSLQSVSIIAAFPIGIVFCLIIASFFKDAKAYLNEMTARHSEHKTEIEMDEEAVSKMAGPGKVVEIE